MHLLFSGDPTLYGNLKTPSVFVQAIEDSLRCVSLLLSHLMVLCSISHMHAARSSIMVIFTQLEQRQRELPSPHVTRCQLRPSLLMYVFASLQEYDIASLYMVSRECACARRPGLPQACRSG
jgi:hypothetical protein